MKRVIALLAVVISMMAFASTANAQTVSGVTYTVNGRTSAIVNEFRWTGANWVLWRSLNSNSTGNFNVWAENYYYFYLTAATCLNHRFYRGVKGQWYAVPGTINPAIQMYDQGYGC